MYILICTWYILCCTEYIHVYVRFCSLTGLSITLKPDQRWPAYLTLLTPVTRLWRYSFSAWIGILPLARLAFQRQSCLNCTRKQSIFLTSYRKTSLTRPERRPSGISKRHTASCTRSTKLCCGETRITRRVKHQRYNICVCTRS